MAMTDRDTRRERLKLLALAAVFIGPLLLAFGLYLGQEWLPTRSVANGELIAPPLELPNNPFSAASGARFRGVWSLVIVAPGECDDTCQKALYETRQLRQALGRDQDRVQRVWVVVSGEPDFHYLLAEHPELLILDRENSVGAELLSRLNRQGEVDIFVVDPLGNLMMRFPADLGMRAMHTDMKRLLKASQIG
jgi:hypothetical protein